MVLGLGRDSTALSAGLPLRAAPFGGRDAWASCCARRPWVPPLARGERGGDPSVCWPVWFRRPGSRSCFQLTRIISSVSGAASPRGEGAPSHDDARTLTSLRAVLLRLWLPWESKEPPGGFASREEIQSPASRGAVRCDTGGPGRGHTARGLRLSAVSEHISLVCHPIFLPENPASSYLYYRFSRLMSSCPEEF